MIKTNLVFFFWKTRETDIFRTRRSYHKMRSGQFFCCSSNFLVKSCAFKIKEEKKILQSSKNLNLSCSNEHNDLRNLFFSKNWNSENKFWDRKAIVFLATKEIGKKVLYKKGMNNARRRCFKKLRFKKKEELSKKKITNRRNIRERE